MAEPRRRGGGPLGPLLLAAATLAAGTARAQPGPLDLESAPGAERRVSLRFQDADLKDVLRLMAEAGGLDVVIGEEVEGRVHLSFRDARWADAMAALLASRSLGVERTETVLWVDTLEAMARAARLRSTASAARSEAQPLVTRILHVRYARAAELAPLVRGLLSPRGRVTVDARTNALVVTDHPEPVARASAFVRLPSRR